ncbi:MAG: sugar ABC transporter permease [Hamadaea sp.]|nr:sugar ABC transporter permease [Hamadaea sp.]
MVDTPTPVRRTPLLGLLFAVPAVLMLCSGYVVPTVRLLWTSLHRTVFFREGGDFVGLDNYGRLDTMFGGGTFLAIGLGLATGAVAVVGGGGLAYFANRAGRVGRRFVWIGFALPVAALSSVAIASAWQLAISRREVNAFPDVEPGYAVVVLLATFGLLVGVGAAAYLLVFRSARKRGLAAGLAALVLVGATLAVTLQSLAAPLLIATRREDAPPVLGIYNSAFRLGNLGVSAAGSVVLLLVLALLGVAVTAAVVFAQARLVRVEQPEPAGNPGFLAITLVVGGGALLVGIVGLLPWLLDLADFGRLPDGPFEPWLLSWGPTLISTVVGVGAAVLAGFGIGALRPLGRNSHLLLLPFAPWLFTGLGVTMVDAFQHLWRHDSDNFLFAFLRAIPPSSLNIPALVLSAVLFRGLTTQDSPARSWRTAAPVVALVALVTWVVQANDVIWSLISVTDPGNGTMPYLAVSRGFAYSFGTESLVGWLYPIPGYLLTAAAIAVVGVFVLDRLALHTGPEDQPQ